MGTVHQCLLALAVLAACALGENADIPVTQVRGRILLPSGQYGDVIVVVQTTYGDQLRGFVSKDGTFIVSDLPPGSHLLNVFALGYIFPEVRLDISQKSGLFRAVYSQNKQQVLGLPLQLRPHVEAQYFEKRKPIDVWSFVKSPYGLMIGFMLFGIFVFPRMKVDPEEYSQIQEEWSRSSGGGAQNERPARQRIARE